MIYAYIRVSTDKQTTENQRFEILKFADKKKLAVGEWVEETVSSTKPLKERKLGSLINHVGKDDILLTTELSRRKSEGKQLGRPKGRLSAKVKLTGKDDIIKELFAQKDIRCGYSEDTGGE